MSDDATRPCRGSNPETLCHRELKPPPESYRSIRQHRSCFRLHEERLRPGQPLRVADGSRRVPRCFDSNSGQDSTVLASLRQLAEGTFAPKARLLSSHNTGELMSPPLPNRRIGSSAGLRRQVRLPLWGSKGAKLPFVRLRRVAGGDNKRSLPHTRRGGDSIPTLTTTIGLRENRFDTARLKFSSVSGPLPPTTLRRCFKTKCAAQLRPEKAAKSLIKTVFITIDQPFGSRSGNAALADTNWSDEHR